MYVNLSSLPSPKVQHQILMNDFSGGVNLRRASTEIANNQSPNMVNLLWANGSLKRRPGQKQIAIENEEPFLYQLKSIIAVHDRGIDNKMLFAYWDIDGCIAIAYCTLHDSVAEIITISRNEVGELASDANRSGVFFEYGEHIYFKGCNCYRKIFQCDDGSLSDEAVAPYTPIVLINTNPATGVGDLYQPENRLSAQKEVWYNADSGIRYAEFNCDGETSVFVLPHKGGGGHESLLAVQKIYIGAALADPEKDYSVDIPKGTIATAVPPLSGLKVTVEYALLMCEYTLPVSIFDSVDEVRVKNLSTGEYETYRDRSGVGNVDDPEPGVGDFILKAYGNSEAGFRIVIHFCDPNGITQYEGNSVTDPNVLNTFVKVKYSKDNIDALKAIDECTIATTYGSGSLDSNCIVLAGASAQPNAFFWSGNDSNGGNPGYFPIDHYNLAGEYHDPIVAFGKQQNKLVIFQENRIGSATFSLDEVDGRTVVSLPYMTINDRFGCNLPHSIQLIENNLVWAHTQHGVLYLKDSTYAYETLTVSISGNINDTLLYQEFDCVSSIDDGKRYWLFNGERAYVWDYSIQGYTGNTEKLSWFIMSNMRKCNTNSVKISDRWIRIDAIGKIFALDAFYSRDFDDSMHCTFRTKDFCFGTYSYRKNVEKVIFTFPRIEEISAAITYESDLGIRSDLINVQIPKGEVSDVGAFVRVRAPKCRHIHTFSVAVSSVEDKPFELISMQILYSFSGTRTIKAGQRM